MNIDKTSGHYWFYPVITGGLVVNNLIKYSVL